MCRTSRPSAAWLTGSAALRRTFFERGKIARESTPDVIETHLRGDSALSSESAERIAGIVREAYDLLAQPKEIAVACHLRAARTFRPEASGLFTELLREMREALLAED